MDKYLEAIAIVLHLYDGGLHPGEYKEAMGIEKTPWEKVSEWKKDEFRLQAKMVVQFLKDHNIGELK